MSLNKVLKILSILLVLLTLFVITIVIVYNVLIKHNNIHTDDLIIFNETPFKYTPNKTLKSPEDVPSYQDIKEGPNELWDCGKYNYDPTEAMCFQEEKSQPYNPKDQSGNDNIYALCNPTLTPWYSKCCQSQEGCRPKGLFNWIIGTCNGNKGGNNCGANPNKSQLIVNYVGSYQYDPKKHKFICQQDSSFNMDGRHLPYDTSQVYGGLGKGKNWLPGPLPGGAANWKQGFYPAGRTGVGAPAMMFIISVNKISNSCWYVLNQSDLDRGPQSFMDNSQCNTKMDGNTNTWGCNNSGEFDFLEPPCNGKFSDEDYLKGYSTGMSPYNLGQYGRCIFWSQGLYGGHWGGGGWKGSTKYFTMDKGDDKGVHRIFVGVVDQMGMRTYQIPGDNSEKYWKGIRINSADMELPVGPLVKPKTSPCDSKTSFCANFNPFCPIEAGGPENYDKFKCMADGRDRGFCGNWVHRKLEFLGPESLWGTDNKKPIVDGITIGSWNADMESAPVT
jgi:hypothetical protein